MKASPQRITPSPSSLSILERIQSRCGLRDLQTALNLLTMLKGEQLLAQLDLISSTESSTLKDLAAIDDSVALSRSPATPQPDGLDLEEPPSLESLL